MDNDSPECLKRRIKELKKAVSENRKKIDAGSLNKERLLSENRSLSAQLKPLEKALKAKLNKYHSTTNAEQTPTLPAYLTDLHKELSEPVTIVCERPDSSDWSHFLNHHARTSANHNPMLLTATSEFYQQEQLLLVARTGDTVVGGMPLVVLDTPLFGRFAASTPFFSYGGPLTDYRDVAEALIDHSRTLLTKHNLDNVIIRTCIGGLPFSCFDGKVSMTLQLPVSEDSLDELIPSKVRSQTKKSNRYNLRFKTGGQELLDDFYRVLSENMRDLGSPFHSKEFFKNLITRMPDKITLAAVYHEQTPVSAGLLLAQDRTLEIPWASTLKRANKLNANMWFYYMILKHAVNNRFSHFDFGRSSRNSGTYHFKKQWGAVSAQHYWYRISKDDSEFRPTQESFSLLINLWRLMPVWLTKWVGPKIIKGIA